MIHYTMGLESNGCSTLRDERQTQAPYQSIPFTLLSHNGLPGHATWAAQHDAVTKGLPGLVAHPRPAQSKKPALAPHTPRDQNDTPM